MRGKLASQRGEMRGRCGSEKGRVHCFVYRSTLTPAYNCLNFFLGISASVNNQRVF
jgi:hypothetical protein